MHSESRVNKGLILFSTSVVSLSGPPSSFPSRRGVPLCVLRQLTHLGGHEVSDSGFSFRPGVLRTVYHSHLVKHEL